MREVLKKLWTAFYVALVLFVVAVIFGTIVKSANPMCRTCSSREAMAVWLIALAAHQPVIWTDALTFGRRFATACTALVVGVLVYFVVGLLAAAFFTAGNVTAGALTAGSTSIVGGITAFVVSRVSVRRRERVGWRRPGLHGKQVDYPATTVVRIAWKLFFSVALFAVAVVVAYLAEEARVLNDFLAWLFLIGGYGTVLYFLWRFLHWYQSSRV